LFSLRGAAIQSVAVVSLEPNLTTSGIIAILNTLSPHLNRRTLKQLTIVVEAVLAMTGRVTMLGLSRWAEKETYPRKLGMIIVDTPPPWVHYLDQWVAMPSEIPILQCGKIIMTNTNSNLTRRHFLKTSLAIAGAAALPQSFAGVQGTPTASSAKFIRYNVMSEGGQRALASYAKGIKAMLNLPPEHPQNWFRNAFIHFMDCPHGNWWFYVWHRGYLGYFEQTIRKLSGDNTFAMPYWDWTSLPQIPDSMFIGSLNPMGADFEPYTRNLAVFTAFIKPALTKYWNNLSTAQRGQLNKRGYTDLDLLWNDVTGYSPSLEHGIADNMAFAITCAARYLTRDNPKLDAKTSYNVSPEMVHAGLQPKFFYHDDIKQSFTSSKTDSHNSPPTKTTNFSVLEGFPHNKVHNFIGGVGPVDPGPYGNMTNNLSPVDPIFFLHHSNMDRLWDIWTRKQKHFNLPYLPPLGKELDDLSNEPFLFYVTANGEQVGNNSLAGEYLSTGRFDYTYDSGFGEDIMKGPIAEPTAKQAMPLVNGSVEGNSALLAIPSAAIKNHLAATGGVSLLMAEVTLPWPSATSNTREFDVIVGAPSEVTQVDADSPYYAGTIAFFGKMAHMKDMSPNATFSFPLPKSAKAFHLLGDAENTPVNIRVVPTQGGKSTPTVKGVSVRASD